MLSPTARGTKRDSADDSPSAWGVIRTRSVNGAQPHRGRVLIRPARRVGMRITVTEAKEMAELVGNEENSDGRIGTIGPASKVFRTSSVYRRRSILASNQGVQAWDAPGCPSHPSLEREAVHIPTPENRGSCPLSGRPQESSPRSRPASYEPGGSPYRTHRCGCGCLNPLCRTGLPDTCRGPVR